MIITAHQSNYLPGMSVVTKIMASDAVIWLDEVQYSHGGWSNRNKMPDGSWLTVPVEKRNMKPFNRVRISEHGGWRLDHVSALKQHYGDTANRLCMEILRPYRLLIGLNLALLRILLEDVDVPWHFQSHLDGGHAVSVVSENGLELLPISERLAMMVQELGGHVYLSGPSGRNYLDERPFHERNIHVKYFSWPGANDCSVSRLVKARL